MPHIFGYKESKEDTHKLYYLAAAGLATLIAFTIIFGSKLLFYLGRVIIEHWVWAIGIIIGSIILKKVLFKKRRKKVYEDPNREV